LDQVYYDLDGVRSRLVRLTEMDRLPRDVGKELTDGVLELQSRVEEIILEGVEKVS